MRWYEEETSKDATPKLLLFANLRTEWLSSPENLGRLTPPLFNMGSIPFEWEERPGKAIVPGGGIITISQEGAVSCNKSLNLPPRLHKLSPDDHAAVDSAYILNNTAQALSFGLAARNPDQGPDKGRAFFGSWGRRRSHSYSNAAGSEVALTKIRRGRSLLGLSQQARLWEKISGRLKKLLPWKSSKKMVEAGVHMDC